MTWLAREARQPGHRPTDPGVGLAMHQCRIGDLTMHWGHDLMASSRIVLLRAIG